MNDSNVDSPGSKNCQTWPRAYGVVGFVLTPIWALRSLILSCISFSDKSFGFLGEVDDGLAAADYLAIQEAVDPKPIYLSGHSTGGTLLLLVAEATDRFRAVFSLELASDVGYCLSEFIPSDTSNPRDVMLRSPGYWLSSNYGPTLVFEGTEQGNLSSS